MWHTERQPDRRADGRDVNASPSTPDAILVGHADAADFALACSGDGGAYVASGGRDAAVLVWAVEDGVTASGPRAPGAPPTATLQPASRLAGHAAPVEDVCFAPGGASHLLASVGDDGALLLWDTRTGGRPVASVRAAHGASAPDVQCVDWAAPTPDSGAAPTGLLVTGAEDGGVRVWDPRALVAAGGAPTPRATLTLSDAAVLRVEWSPSTPGVFASGGDAGVVALWDVSGAGVRGASDGDGRPRALEARVRAAAEGDAATTAAPPPPPRTLLRARGPPVCRRRLPVARGRPLHPAVRVG